MMRPRATPGIYHIPLVNDRTAIIASGGLISDAAILACNGRTVTLEPKHGRLTDKTVRPRRIQK